MLSQQIDPHQLQTFQEFLDKMMARESFILIEPHVYARNEAIILIVPIATTDTATPDDKILRVKLHRGQYIPINLGGIVLANISGVHALLMGQPVDAKKYFIAQHKKMFADALMDFYLEYQKRILAERYLKDSIVKELPGHFIDILNMYIDDNINLNFNEKKLKQWSIHYSLIGLEMASHVPIHPEQRMKLHDNASTKKFNHFLESSDFEWILSYADNGNENFIFLMKRAMKDNLYRLGLNNIDYIKSMDELWEDLGKEQVEAFKKVSHVNYRPLLWKSVLMVVAAVIAVSWPAWWLICLAVMFICSTAVSFKMSLHFDRIVNDEFKLRTSASASRSAMLESLLNQYTPRQNLLLTLKDSGKDKKQITTYKYDHFDVIPDQAPVRIYPRKKTPKEKTSSRALIQAGIRAAPKAWVAKETTDWMTSDGEVFIPPETCYKIGSNCTYTPYGYITQRALHQLTCNLSGKKKQKMQEEIGDYFVPAAKQNDSGIVFFKVQNSNQIYAKLKLKAKGLQEVKIPGEPVATGPNGNRLYCFDDVKKIKHNKKGH